MAKKKITLTEDDVDELTDIIFYAQRALKLDADSPEVEELEDSCRKWDEKFRKVLGLPE